ncbi:glycosyltransferase [Xylanimonas sp. McL0601]|uniref:glycosyltransferase n=1 Tax=Xylanimonas sp. McL0601 TaxID=3414739 RepID=UPI003CE96A53
MSGRLHLPSDGSAIDWSAVPAAPVAVVPEELTGAVIIPAHNEQAVIGRTLRSLAPLAALHQFDVVVVCNGTTDATPDIARSFDFVRVVELDEPSKTAALNAGDDVATHWPRLYLDADIELAPEAVRAVFEVLTYPGVLAARPVHVYDIAHASMPVRAYYRARGRVPVPGVRLWGAGGYAVNERGHGRFVRFPRVTADDSWLDGQFQNHEKRVVTTIPMRVRTPADVTGLMAVLTRQRRGYVELGIESAAGRRLRTLVASIRGPRSAVDAAWYVVLTMAARRRSARALRHRGDRDWERDASSRTMPDPGRPMTTDRPAHHRAERERESSERKGKPQASATR